MFDGVLSIDVNCVFGNCFAKVVHYLNRSSHLLSAEAAFRRLGYSHLGTLRQCDFRFNAHRTGETACIFAGVNGNQKCSDFGNSECSIFGIKTTVLLASAVQ